MVLLDYFFSNENRDFANYILASISSLLVPDNQTYTFFLKNSFLKFWKSCVDDSLKKIKIKVFKIY